MASMGGSHYYGIETRAHFLERISQSSKPIEEDMQIEIKPFTVKPRHVAALGFATFIYGTYLAGCPQAGFIVTGGVLVIAAGINWMSKNGF